MSSVDKPNEPRVGTYGLVDIPPYGEQGVPVRWTPFTTGDVASGALQSVTGSPKTVNPALGRLTPRPVTLQAMFNNSNAQGNNPATTYTFMSFPQVTPGKIWMVLRIGVTAPDPFTTLAGVTVLAFRSSTIPQDSNTEPPTFGDLIAVLGAVPNTSYPAWKSVFARGNERIALALKGLANSQGIQASMDIIEYDLYTYLCALTDGS
jgi:hypothetical protein